MNRPIAQVKKRRWCSAALGLLIVGVLLIGTSGCGGKKVEGVYHAGPNSPISITFKSGKATVNIGGSEKTLDYKIDGKKITIANPQEGDIVLTINDDGTLTSPMGTLTKNPS